MQHTFRKPTIPERALAKFGIWEDRRLYWSFYEPRNFGDWIGPYLFYKITGKQPFFQKPSKGIPTILTAGSIMRWIKAPNSAVVWGSGIISREDEFERPKEILAVRGPLTQQRCQQLDYSCPEVYGDPGILLPRVFQPVATHEEMRLGVIPHYAEQDLARQVIPNDPSIRVIDVTAPLEDVITLIASCQAVISSSLHGLIIAHAYGVPAGWVRFSNLANPRIKGDGTKYQDYILAFGDETLECMGIEEVKDFDASALERHIAKAPLPDHSKAAKALWSCCPFLPR